MACARNGQPLGYALNYADYYYFYKFYEIHIHTLCGFLQEHYSLFGTDLIGVLIPYGHLHLADMRFTEQEHGYA